MHIVEWLGRSLLILLIVSAMPASGADEVQTVPGVTTWVTDVPGIIPEARKVVLEAKLEKLAKERDQRIGIVLVATTQPETVEAYGARVVDVWRRGVAGGKDGVFLLVAKDDGRVFLDVGRGRAVMPYQDAMRVVKDVMVPHFQLGDYATGIDAGINAMADYIATAQKSNDESPTAFEPGSALAGVSHIWGGGMVGALVVASVLGRLIGRMLAGVVGGAAAACIVWLLAPVAWIAIVCGVLAFFLLLGAPPGKSLRVLGAPATGAGGTVGASGGWA